MTFDPTSPPLRPRWLTGLFGPRSTRERLTHVSELPPRILDDIGISRDLVDAMQRHRR